MNAKQIRIGNLFNFGSIEFRVDSIRGGMVIMNDCGGIISSSIAAYIDKLNGLPITPQLLLSHSFKQSTDNIWYDFQDGSYLELREVKDGWHVTLGDSPEMSCDSEQRICITSIQYFHQLQNLIYDMKGIEI